MAHPDHDRPRPLPTFSLGVVAPLGFAPPGLERFVKNKLRAMLIQKRRTHRVFVQGVMGETVFRAAVELAQLEFGTNGASPGGGGRPNRYAEHLRACANVATFADAVVIVHDGTGLTADMRRLVDVCRWLRTEVRVLAFAGDPAPL